MLLSPRPREYWPSGWRWRGGVGGQRRLVPSQAPAAAARLGHSGLGGRPARPHPAPHRGLCPKSPQPFWLPRGSAFPETQGAVGCKGLNKRQAVFHCYWQKNSCLVPRESPPNPQFCRFAQRALEKCPGGRKSSCVPWGWRINVTPTESCQPCPKAMSPWHLGRGPPCPPSSLIPATPSVSALTAPTAVCPSDASSPGSLRVLDAHAYLRVLLTSDFQDWLAPKAV